MGFYFNITFVKKYLFGFTSREEEMELLDNPEVNGRMAKVWDNFSDIKTKDNLPDSDKIFEQIKEKANIPDKQIYSISEHEDFRYKWYKSSLTIAASAILFLVLGIFGTFYYNKHISNSLVEVVSEKGQRKEFTLPDGTRVWLNSDTKIKYRKQFNQPIREVILVGEAYFSVTKDATRPFIVKTSKLDIKVLGTVFNVKSYPNDKTIETTLVSGLVSIEKNTGKKANESPVLVKPKQKAVFSLGAEQIKLESVNIDKTTSWRSGKLVFDNESISSVLDKLQRWYGIKVEIVDYVKCDDRYTMTIKDENIEEVIHLLQLTTPVTFKVEDLNGSDGKIYEPNKKAHEINNE
jgi:ferric-dicitrate binding protein FerR (iron transport regulator)